MGYSSLKPDLFPGGGEGVVGCFLCVFICLFFEAETQGGVQFVLQPGLFRQLKAVPTTRPNLLSVQSFFSSFFFFFYTAEAEANRR